MTARLGRRPIPVICKCKRVILTALDADMYAITARLDPYALTPEGEVWALKSGRATYLLDRSGIHRRTRWNIPGRPPAVDRVVLAWHECPDTTPLVYRLKRPRAAQAKPTDPNYIPF